MNKSINYFWIICLFLIVSLHFLNGTGAIEYKFLGGRPANPNPDIPNSASWFIYNLDKGQSKEDAILVMNNFEEDLDVLVYAADSIKSSSGGFALKQLTEKQTQVGSWIKFYPHPIPDTFKQIFDENNQSIIKFCALEVTYMKELFDEWCDGVDLVELKLGTQKAKEIKFVFSVPKDAEIGEHTGGILIQKSEPEKDLGESQGISITTRVGVRIYQIVPGDIIKDIKISNFSVVKNYQEFDYRNFFSKDKKPETIIITTEIENLGNVSVDFKEVLTIRDEIFDKRTEEIKDRSFQVLREDTFKSNYEWHNPRFGKFTFIGNIKYVDQDDNPQLLTSKVITIWIIPWKELVLAIATILLITLPIVTKKIIRKKKYSGKGWHEYVTKKGDSFETITSNIDVHWKIFAKTNRLKPPYTLKQGQKILVPHKRKTT